MVAGGTKITRPIVEMSATCIKWSEAKAMIASDQLMVYIFVKFKQRVAETTAIPYVWKLVEYSVEINLQYLNCAILQDPL
jgi:hypothetical protein